MVSTININVNPAIPALPRIEDKKNIDIRYMLISPYASAHIFWDKNVNELVYELEEPILQDYEKEALNQLENAMMELINVNVALDKTIESITLYIDKTARLLIDELNLKISPETYIKIFYFLFRDFIGLNEIDPLLRDYFIEDIECNGVDTPIYIIHRVYRNLRTNLSFKDIDKLASFVEKLAQRSGRYISYAQPLLDGTLPDGSRVNATYTKDVTSRGPTFCFKKGYVQLNDGRVKQVEELFEESKRNFGSKIEEENEVVEPNNLNCCGVDEKTLEQKDSRIKSIIKIKSPEKLVRIIFEDGGDVEVTLDHLFHVAGNSLSLVKASELKAGMIVPMPRKINVEGYRQKINVCSLIKDFSYIKRVSIITTPEIKNIVINEIGENKYGRLGQSLSEKYGLECSYFYGVVSRGNSVSFQVIDNICKNQNIDFNNLKEIALNVYGGGTKGKSKTIKVPKELDEDLAYITGLLVSDGHLSSNSIDFCCYEEGIRNSIKHKLVDKFGRFESYYNDNRVYVCNSFIPYFFNKIFGLPIGKKSRIVKIPEIIFKSDNKVIAPFIRGLFDGDGTVSAGLSYKTYSKELAEGLTYLLGRLGILSYLVAEKEGFRVNIPAPDYLKYNEIIGFDELKKANKLKELIEKQVEHKTFIRHDRIPGAPILSIIKKIGINKKQILKDCKVSYNRIYQTTFSKNFAKALLKEIKANENASKVKEEIDYLEWVLGSNQEFTMIKSVEVINNNEPVYDIELEPCKFFVAGNRPMNMFDTIRKFTKVPWTPTQLISMNTLSPEMLAYFWLLVQYKTNILIAGGTAAGKTTLLNGIAFFIPPEARVVSIEDSVTGDSKIIIRENEKIRNITIKEFVENKIKAEVMTVDKKGIIQWVEPSDYIKHNVKKDIYEVTTSTGRKIKVTQDHSLFTLGEDNSLEEVKPTELREGKSSIVVVKGAPEHPIIFSDIVKKIKKLPLKEREVFDLTIPGYEKFICNNVVVHNTRELNLPRENWLPAVSRTSIGIGKVGEVDLFALLKSSFRQNPDYLIVGEVRGKEAFELFQGMASGHSSISTMHADSVDTLIRRLQTPPIELSPTLVNSLDCVAVATHALSGKNEVRRVREIVEIINVNKDGTALINTPFKWDPAKDVFYYKKQNKAFEKISAKTGIPVEKLYNEMLTRAKLIYMLYQQKVFGFNEVQSIINAYYKNPVEVLNRFGIME